MPHDRFVQYNNAATRYLLIWFTINLYYTDSSSNIGYSPGEDSSGISSDEVATIQIKLHDSCFGKEPCSPFSRFAIQGKYHL